MAKCSWDFEFTAPPSVVVAGIREYCVSHDGYLHGDDRSGTFDGKILAYPTHLVGNYTITGHSIHIEITKKPWIACATLKHFIEGAIQETA